MVPYLVRVGLVPASAARQFSVDDLTARNRNFAVTGPGGRAFFVKQAAFTTDLASVAREGVVLSSVERAQTALAPRVCLRDDDLGVLVVDLVQGETLRARLSCGRISDDVASALGRGLADLHELAVPDVTQQRPWILEADRPGLDILRDASVASLTVIKLVQGSDAIRAGIETLRRAWRASGLAHGDVRWDNVLALPDAEPCVCFVDWERAGPGDWRLDVGAVLGEHLWWWVDSMRVGRRPDPFGAARSARLPLADMRQGIASFWGAYLARRRLPVEAGDALVADAMSFAAGRLVEGAIERTADSSVVDGRVLLALQVAANVFVDPRTAASDLFGLGIECS